MVKICQTRLLKLNFDNHTKKTHFPVFAKNFRRPCMKLKNFPNPWTLRVSGMGGYTSKCEKSQNHCTLLASVKLTTNFSGVLFDLNITKSWLKNLASYVIVYFSLHSFASLFHLFVYSFIYKIQPKSDATGN
jgi:hypothetical protein